MFIDVNQTMLKSKQTKYESIYMYFKDEIIHGNFKSHDKLPSKRKLSKDLNVSQTTIERAYVQLLDEGLIYSKERSGFYVSPIETLHVNEKSETHIVRNDEETKKLTLGRIDPCMIQTDVLKKIAKNVFDDISLMNMGDVSGEKELKCAIQKYLYQTRGVQCVEDQIFIGPSTEYLLRQVLLLLDYPDITIEDPGYPVVKHVLKRYKSTFNAVPVLNDGINIDAVIHRNARIVHVTPSHQFPTGRILSYQKRVRLLNYVERVEGYVIEDDYDSEFRYTGQPLSSMFGLDQNDRTIYMCTFSKSMFPSLRISCMVLPKGLAEKYYQENMQSSVSRHMQLILAKFIDGGYLDRHINRVKKYYGEKMDRILKFLNTYHPHIEWSGHHTGMHFILKVKGKNVESIARNHQLISLNEYAINQEYSDSVVIGIGESSVEDIQNVLQQFLEDVLKR